MARFNFEVPAELELIVRKRLAADPARRFQGAQDLRLDLENLQRELAAAESLRSTLSGARPELPAVPDPLGGTIAISPPGAEAAARAAEAAVDLEHYEAIGGMEEALSRRADEVYLSLPSEGHRDAAARLFRALTEKAADNRGVRRPTRLGRLVAIAGGGAPSGAAWSRRWSRPSAAPASPSSCLGSSASSTSAASSISRTRA
jgi:hypothetical protein